MHKNKDFGFILFFIYIIFALLLKMEAQLFPQTAFAGKLTTPPSPSTSDNSFPHLRKLCFLFPPGERSRFTEK